MNSYTIDSFLRTIYKKISRDQLEHARETIAYVMSQVEDRKIRYSLFVAWANLALNNPTRAHEVIRDLHYRITVA